MEGIKTLEVEEELALPSPSLIVAVAVSGGSKSKYAVKWALEKFVPEGRILIKLLHVRPRITKVPTPMGNYVQISQVRDDVADAYRKEMEWQTSRMLLPYKKMCTDNKVEVEVVMIEEDDVPLAISGEVSKFEISKLVIGASSRSRFTRKFKGDNISARISECSPSFCTVYVVSKGKLSSVRPSTSKTNGSIKRESSDTSFSTSTCSSYNFSSQTDTASVASHNHFHGPSLQIQQRFQALSTINHTLLKTRSNSTDTSHSRSQSVDTEDTEDAMSTCSSNSDAQLVGSQVSNFRSLHRDHLSWNHSQASMSDIPTETSSSENQVDINFEVERLRIELRHARGLYAVAQNETIDASRQLKKLSECRIEEATKLKEISIREEGARELARHEKEKHEAAKMEAEFVRECVEREALQRKQAEIKGARDAKEKQSLEKALESPGLPYKKFTWEEIVSASSSFSDDLRIGLGAYGTVYKCTLHHVTVAVKVLHSKEGHRTKQFQQELEILSNVRHPHLLLLLGACIDQGCLIYEYMENGSLEDRLLRKNNTPPIPWFDRFRIAWEVASALFFLHNSKPKPIIHRDLKPANILLDHNFVSKIGDIGLSTLLPSIDSSMSTLYKDSGPVGTLCYIDPEYQRSGLVSPKSDVYAFGMVILQLLTAQPALALAHKVETALENGTLEEILDSEAGIWPTKETHDLAVLGLSCVELRRIDRPDLKVEVLPILEKLKGIADKARDLVPSVVFAPPSLFICPILKDIMEDPCVASDGYTYDRKAIEIWLQKNDKSPMTNFPLPDKNLIPNYTILSAIMEWKSKNQ